MIITLGCLPLLWQSLRHFDAMQWFGVFLLPFVLRINKDARGRGFYLVPAVIFSGFYLLLGQYYWTFAAALSILYHLIDTRIGKLNAVAFYTIIFYLPLTRSFFTLFGFYIRMEITKWAGWLLSFVNQSVTYLDSQIWVDGNAFTVDAGCMGLRLVITGFIFTLLLVQQLSKRQGKEPTRKILSIALFLSFLFVVIANFFRILLIIQFRSPANSWSHELLGLGAFALFHLIPMYWMVRWLVNRMAVDTSVQPSTASPILLRNWPVLLMVSVMLIRSNFFPSEVRYSGNEGLTSELGGYELQVSKDGVHRYSNANSVLLVKPMFPLSFSNHHPMLCWRGDGFDVVGEVRSKLGETDCFRAVLERPDQQLTTCWWFMNQNGDMTMNEWEWRWRSLTKGEQFFLVNFVATNESDLIYSMNLTRQGALVIDG